jgi:hypothetical protein
MIAPISRFGAVGIYLLNENTSKQYNNQERIDVFITQQSLAQLHNLEYVFKPKGVLDHIDYFCDTTRRNTLTSIRKHKSRKLSDILKETIK